MREIIEREGGKKREISWERDRDDRAREERMVTGEGKAHDGPKERENNTGGRRERGEEERAGNEVATSDLRLFSNF